MEKQVMIDLETLGTTPECVTISLGACFFDLVRGTIGPTFYLALDVQDQIDKGRKIDADTIKWWMGQSGAAKKVFAEGAKSPAEVLTLFSAWLNANSGTKERFVWGNGATFDISIMESLYRTYNIKVPWLFYNVMDVRTFRKYLCKNEKIAKGGVNHNALDDAHSQAQFIIDHFKGNVDQKVV